MKILVLSDNHGNSNDMLEVLRRVKPVDMVIHCGDIDMSPSLLEESAGCPVKIVRGNNDYNYSKELPSELIVNVGKTKIFVTHGHTYFVNFNLDRLTLTALEKGATIAMYGHTHIPKSDYVNGVYVFNPGSISYPRQAERRGTYGMVDIDEKGKRPPEFSVCYL